MSLYVRRIDKARDFMALGPLWNKLAGESGQLSPFLSYDWFWCCWHGVWPKHRPEILILEDEGTPVAIIPLMHWRERFRGLPVRCLGFLTYPNAPMSDLLTVVEYGRVVKTLLDYLARRSDWDMVWLQKLPAISPTVKELEGNLPGRLPWRRAGNAWVPYLEIEGDWKSFCTSYGQGVQQTLQQLQAHLPRAGDLTLEEHRVMDPWSPSLQDVITMINRSPKQERRGNSPTIPRLPEFLRELTRRATKNGWLSLWQLRLNGRIIALEYQLRAAGKVLALWTAENSVWPGFSSAGALQLAILQAIFEEGTAHEYGTVVGVEGKPQWWASASHETVHLKLYRPGLYSRLLHRLEKADESGAYL
jgi:CelD/BcsL family acetyltransferase involved in cellulose biosynthesis